MFKQMDEDAFNSLQRLYSSFWAEHPGSTQINDALSELLLYRKLGTLQQLSYATDAAAELRKAKAERDKYVTALGQIASCTSSFPGDVVDIAKKTLENKS